MNLETISKPWWVRLLLKPIKRSDNREHVENSRWVWRPGETEGEFELCLLGVINSILPTGIYLQLYSENLDNWKMQLRGE